MFFCTFNILKVKGKKVSPQKPQGLFQEKTTFPLCFTDSGIRDAAIGAHFCAHALVGGTEIQHLDGVIGWKFEDGRSSGSWRFSGHILD